MNQETKRVVLVTGANRGIGFEACRQLARAGFAVVLTSRDAEKGEKARQSLQAEGLAVRYECIDIANTDSVEAGVQRLQKADINVDVLVNNAGVCPRENSWRLDEDMFFHTLQCNLLGAWRLSRALVPAMMQRGYGRVVNVSSEWGSFAEGLAGPIAYAVSKAALNALTVTMARDAGDDVKVNAMCPGWVRTDMGGAAAPRSTLEATSTLLWLAGLPAAGPTGGFFRDQKLLGWLP